MTWEATQPVTHRWCSSCGVAVVVVALLAPSAHVPPAWWQGGWRRQCVGSAEKVELLSSLAAMLMPKMPVGDLFRSFPSPDEEDDLEPALTAWGVLKDPNAALFVLYDGKHGKRENITLTRHELRKQLLAYGPPGSHILHINHTESRPLEDMVSFVKVGYLHPGDEASLSCVLCDIQKQVSHELRHFLCPEVLERFCNNEGSLPTSDLNDSRKASVALRGAMVKDKLLENRLLAKGFSPASTSRMLKSAHLMGKCVKAKLESRIQWLLDLNQNLAPIQEVIATSCPSVGDTTLQKNQQEVHLVSDLGLDQKEVRGVIAACPSICLCSIDIVLQNLERSVLWLLDLGLSHKQVVKVVGCFPEVLHAGNSTMEWFFKLGMTKNQFRKAAGAFPLIFACSIQEDLNPKLDFFVALGLPTKNIAKLFTTLPHILAYSVDKNLKPNVEWFLKLGLTKNQIAKVIDMFPQSLRCNTQRFKSKVEWLVQLGMSRGQVVKVIAASPQVLGYSVEQNLKPKAAFFVQLGLRQCQVVKLIAAFPRRILGCSVEQTLKPKVKWLLQLGITQNQAAKLIAAFPPVLSYSLEHNLKPKVAWLFQLGMVQGQIAKLIAASPQVFGYSLEQNLKPKAEWFLQMGMTWGQVAKVIAIFPPILGCSIKQNLKPKVAWFLQLGMTQSQVVKVITASPRILGCSVEQNLKVKVEWLAGLGMSQEQVAKLVFAFPPILGLNIDRNLGPKRALLQEVLGACGVLDVVLREPRVLGMSYLRLSTRLRILVKRNETAKLVKAMKMTRKSFKKCFLDDL